MAAFDELPPPRRFGPLHKLYAALRRRAPQVAARAPEAGHGLRVGYREQTAEIVWDQEAELFVWTSGTEAGVQIGRDVEKAAEQIAWTLGAPVSPGPS